MSGFRPSARLHQPRDGLAGFSNYGSSVDLGAPGTCSVARKVATRSAGKLTATSVSVAHPSLRYGRAADHAS